MSIRPSISFVVLAVSVVSACATGDADAPATPIGETGLVDTGSLDVAPDTASEDTGIALDTGAKVDADATPAPTCTDSIKNGAETDVDCGGSTCPKCALDKACAAAADCATGLCTGGKCVAPSCTDLLKNGTETDVDCGGTCPKCLADKLCMSAADCASGICTAGKCAAASCIDMVANGSETDVDCGGFSCPKCVDGRSCMSASDCVSSLCSGGKCITPSCTDMAKNGTETDVDCGGTCAGCEVGKDCLVAADCASKTCTAGKCAASCTDKLKNGTETDVDCGGSCGPCAAGSTCATDADCLGSLCGTVSKKCEYPRTCEQLHTLRPALTSAVYTIDPSGGGSPFTAYCDMSTLGGGWTLVIKANGGLTTFSYDAALWTNSATHNPTNADFNEVEAKLPSFSSVGFSSVLLVLRDPPGSGATRFLTMPLAGTSLQALIGTTNTYRATSLGRATWKSLLSTSSLQPNCNREGVNAQGTVFGDVWPSVRLGIVSNQEADCASPDSWIGVGARGTACGLNPAISVGNSARCSGDGGDLDRAAFGYVFVR